MNDLFEKFLRDIENDVNEFEKAFPGLPSQNSQKQKRVNQLWMKLHELYSKEECLRRSYNEVVSQLTTLSLGLPDWVFSYETPEYNYSQPEVIYRKEDLIEAEDDNEEEFDDFYDEDEEVQNMEPPSAEYLEFLAVTRKHQEERRKEKANAEAEAMKFPPLVGVSNKTEVDSLTAKRLQMETKIAHIYEKSECRDMPFWPIMPLRRLDR